MSDTDLLEIVRGVCVDVLGVEPDEVEPGSLFRDDLEADSLDFAELGMALEDRAGASIPDDELKGAKTVGDVVELLQRLLAGQHV